MARHHSPRHPLFRQRWFADDIIITCVRWYLRFKLSYRELAELVRELGVSVAPSTVLRWVVRYAAHAALRRMGMNNEFNYRWESPVQIRTCPT
jgi:transposase-like protein